jgi:hypothetical protein
MCKPHVAELAAEAGDPNWHTGKRFVEGNWHWVLFWGLKVIPGSIPSAGKK